jgi:phosphoglycolate phosphatase
VAAHVFGQASAAAPVTLVCSGLVGTVISDSGMIDRAYAEAIATQGVVSGTAAYARCMALVHQTRGQSASDVLQILFPDSEVRGQAAHLVFDRACLDAIARAAPTAMPGAEAAIGQMVAAGIRVALLSGFSRRVLTALIDALGWWDRVDLVVGPDDVQRGLPWPDLTLWAMLQVGVTDVRETAAVHGTESGVLSGLRSGAGLVAGVLTGPHTGERLQRAGATRLIPSIADLPALVLPPTEPGSATAFNARPVSPVEWEYHARDTADG